MVEGKKPKCLVWDLKGQLCDLNTELKCYGEKKQMLDHENQQLWDQVREAQQQALALEAESRTLELTGCGPRLSRPMGVGEPECPGPGAGKVAGHKGGLSARAPERTSEMVRGVEVTGCLAGRAEEEPADLRSFPVGQPSGGGISVPEGCSLGGPTG